MKRRKSEGTTAGRNSFAAGSGSPGLPQFPTSYISWYMSYRLHMTRREGFV